MENPIAISKLNDFIFCPASIYFHLIDEDTNTLMYQNHYQINGKKAHRSIDNHTYSDLKNVLQGIDVYSSKYNLTGKIDIYYDDKKLLVERKKKVIKIYDGYVFQIYGEFFGLTEMGYDVEELKIYSMDDNINYPIPLPSEDSIMLKKFENLMSKIQDFNLSNFTQSNVAKCEKCIYSDLCTFRVDMHSD